MSVEEPWGSQINLGGMAAYTMCLVWPCKNGGPVLK